MKPYQEAFIDYLRVEKGLSKNSLSAYNNDLNRYLEHLEKIGITTPNRVKREDITEFLFNLRKKITPISIARILSTVKSFHKFLLREKIITSE